MRNTKNSRKTNRDLEFFFCDEAYERRLIATKKRIGPRHKHNVSLWRALKRIQIRSFGRENAQLQKKQFCPNLQYVLSKCKKNAGKTKKRPIKYSSLRLRDPPDKRNGEGRTIWGL